jgi:hypothetical protein
VRATLLLPPPPPSLCAPSSGALRDRERAGSPLVTSRLLSSGKGFPHGFDLSRYDIAAVITDGSPITIGEHPCKRAGDMFWAATKVVGDEGERGGEPERGGMSGGE